MEGVTVRMNLTQELILALCNMLQLSTKEAGWGIGSPMQMIEQSALAVDVDAKKVLH